jgi:hypothetical protein
MRSVGNNTRRAFRSAGNSARQSSGRSYSPPRQQRYNPPAPAPRVGSNSSGRVSYTAPPPTPAPPPRPKPPSQGDWIGKDTTYQQQQSAYNQALKDYAAQFTAEQGKYNNEFAAGMDKLGLDRTQGAEDLQNDYASRGMLTSGVYADALNDFNKDFDTRVSDMNRAKTNYMDDLTTAKTNFSTEQKTLLNKAYQDAINRYTAKFGV